MSYMKDATGRRLDDLTVTDADTFELPRRRELPGLVAIPSKIMGSAPSVSTNTTSQISSSILIPPDGGAFCILGAKTSRGGSYPDDQGISANTMYGVTTGSPYIVDFTLDTADSTGRFEVKYKRVASQGARLLVMVDGKWEYATEALTITGTGNDLAYGLVTLGAAGTYRLRLECNTGFRFCGLQVAPSDGVSPGLAPRRKVVIVGDSFTEPTITDSASYAAGGDGYGTLISYALGMDVWLAGSGGTGFLQPNTGASRGNLLTRLPEITPFVNGAEVWLTMGINDYGNFTAAQIGTAASTTISTLLGAGATRVVVWGPFWPRGVFYFATNLLATRDAIKAAADTAGQPFRDTLNLPVSYTQPAATTLATTTAASAVTIQTTTALGTGDYYVQIGTGTNAEIRRVGGQSGSGPYQYGFGATDRGGSLANIHTAGEAVTPVGPAVVTGNGKQGTTTGNGTADRYTGSDATHPTRAGHRNLARQMFTIYSRSLDA